VTAPRGKKQWTPQAIDQNDLMARHGMTYADGTPAKSRSQPNPWNDYQRLRKAELRSGGQPFTDEDIRAEWNGLGPDERETELARLRALGEG
jgi:hypothetical protein